MNDFFAELTGNQAFFNIWFFDMIVAQKMTKTDNKLYKKWVTLKYSDIDFIIKNIIYFIIIIGKTYATKFL